MSEIADRLAVEETLRRYMFAVDQADPVALRRVFSENGRLRSADHSFTADEFVAFVLEMKAVVGQTFHQLSNTIVSLAGDEARATSNFHAIHVVPACTPTNAFGEVAQTTDVIMAGQYRDRLNRFDDGWKIVDRFSVVEWQSWTPSTDPSSAV